MNSPHSFLSWVFSNNKISYKFWIVVFLYLISSTLIRTPRSNIANFMNMNSITTSQWECFERIGFIGTITTGFLSQRQKYAYFQRRCLFWCSKQNHQLIFYWSSFFFTSTFCPCFSAFLFTSRHTVISPNLRSWNNAVPSWFFFSLYFCCLSAIVPSPHPYFEDTIQRHANAIKCLQAA